MSKTTVYLLRHAQTIPVEGVENSQWHLSTSGHEQAKALASKLAQLNADVVLSSPYVRARETLAPYLEQQGKDVILDASLSEAGLADTFMSPVEYQELMQRCWQDKDHTGDRESLNECKKRMVSALGRLVENHEGKTILVSSHGAPLAMVLSYFEVDYGYDNWVNMKMPDLFKLVYEDGQGRWEQGFVPA